MSLSKVFFYVTGRVQGVMFRQTLMRGAIKRGISCGATNCKDDRKKVDVTIEGNKEKVDEMIKTLMQGKELNSWGAKISKLQLCDKGLDTFEHEVNTKNVDDFKWNDDCEFYI